MPVFRSSTRSLTRGFIATSVLAGVLLALPALPAHATPALLSAENGVFTGTSGNDTLIIGVDEVDTTKLTNNGFALAAPGFESPLDFDSTVEGIQTRNVPTDTMVGPPLSFFSGDGDDQFKFVGNIGPYNPLHELDLGAGNDTIDASGLTTGIWFTQDADWSTVETVIGSPFDDKIITSIPVHTTPITIWGGAGADQLAGSNGNDVIYGGGGTDRMGGKGGDDIMVASSPLPVVESNVDGGPGSDQFIVQGTSGPDGLELVGYPANFWAVDLDNFDGGYHALNVERGRLDLGGGDDFAFLSEQLAIAGVIGGAGTDQVIVDAFKATANLSTVGSLKRVTVPLANKSLQVNLSAVEQYAIADETVIGTAPTPGGGPHVRTFRIDGTPVANFYAYDPNFTGGVTLAMGDLDADADDEIITAAGPGGGPHVRVFFSDGTDTGSSFYAYDPTFNGGVSVAAIDLNGDGFDEIVTAPAKNSAPLIRVFDLNGILITEWIATGFGNTGLKVARGAHLGVEGGDQILLSAADGAPSQVRAFEADGTPAPQHDAFAPYPGFGGGASVSRGEFAGGGNMLLSDEIVTGAGTGGGPVVRVVQRAADNPSLNTIGQFLAYDASYTGGVEVSTCNANGGNDEIVTVPAHGAVPLVRIFNLNGSVNRRGFMAYGTNFTNGIHVVCGGAISRFFGAPAPTAQPAIASQSVRPAGVSAAAFRS